MALQGSMEAPRAGWNICGFAFLEFGRECQKNQQIFKKSMLDWEDYLDAIGPMPVWGTKT